MQQFSNLHVHGENHAEDWLSTAGGPMPMASDSIRLYFYQVPGKLVPLPLVQGPLTEDPQAPGQRILEKFFLVQS